MQSGIDPYKHDLLGGLQYLLLEQAHFLVRMDWSDPEAVALAEKRGRILQVHRSNVEKTIGMNDEDEQSYGGALTPARREELKRALEQRLLRAAEALGEEELKRRIARRGLEPPDPRLGFPLPPGSEEA